jgi:hypothetical protein
VPKAVADEGHRVKLFLIVAAFAAGVALIVFGASTQGDILQQGGPFMLGLICVLGVISVIVRGSRQRR